jgi:1-aminocyclopropane-1-carboxylate deaminase
MQPTSFSQPIQIEPLLLPGDDTVGVWVMRLDLVHPVVSGNKWFKLHYHLQEAFAQGKKAILTFGGAYSNHIAATAFACRAAGIACMGIIRGERPARLSHTLTAAAEQGMELRFVSRDAYKNRKADLAAALTVPHTNNYYIINEGGYSEAGVKGVTEILQRADTRSFTHICCSVGTGTTLAGLIRSAATNQSVIGISSMKSNHALTEAVTALNEPALASRCHILHDYHLGGYAKCTAALLTFMNEVYAQNAVPTDFVYTGKLFYAVSNMLQSRYFEPASRVLLIHSGGLQGNLSLPAGSLIY